MYTLHDPELPQEVRYVGWTFNPSRRLWNHLKDAQTGKDKSYCGNWKRVVVARGVKPVMTVIAQGVGDGWKPVEVLWIKHYKELGHPITNLTNGGDGSGRKLTQEQRQKIGAAHRGRKHTPETRANMSAAHKGKPLKPEHVESIRNSLRGRKMSAVERLHRTGWKMPSEAIARSAAARRGRKRSDEARAKMRAAHLGKPLTPDHAKRSADGRRGTQRTAATKAKIADSIKAWHAARKKVSQTE